MKSPVLYTLLHLPALGLWGVFADAFVAPSFRAFVVSGDSSLNMLPSSLVLSDEALVVATNAAADVADVAGGGIIDTIEKVLLGITAIIFFLFGATYFVAAVVVPKAAQQLEEDTRRLRPGLWEQFEQRLEPGQTMESRPDLLQELGEIMRPIIIESYEENPEAANDNWQGGGPSAASGSPSVVDAAREAPIVLDAVVESKESETGPPSKAIDVGGDQWED